MYVSYPPVRVGLCQDCPRFYSEPLWTEFLGAARVLRGFWFGDLRMLRMWSWSSVSL